jgi:hypothetical protein
VRTGGGKKGITVGSVWKGEGSVEEEGFSEEEEGVERGREEEG